MLSKFYLKTLQRTLLCIWLISGLTGCATYLMPDGVNQPCPDHSYEVPVVLIHGTFANAQRAFKSLAPTLQRDGRCVFALNYGKRSQLPMMFATGDMKTSAEEINAFIESVREWTGATQVDLIGHSQGGTLALYLGQQKASDQTIRRIVAISPSTRGTQTAKVLPDKSQCIACVQQTPDSEFIRHLHSKPINQANIPILILSTDNDLVVTPVDSHFIIEPSVTNTRLQELFPGKFASHSGILHDKDAVKFVSNWLKQGVMDSSTENDLVIFSSE